MENEWCLLLYEYLYITQHAIKLVSSSIRSQQNRFITHNHNLIDTIEFTVIFKHEAGCDEFLFNI